jgi:hypothetical protein
VVELHRFAVRHNSVKLLSVVAIAAIVASAALPTGCGTATADDPISGVRAGSATVGGGWRLLQEGRSRTPVVWPSGYHPVSRPVELLWPGNHLLAKAGQRIFGEGIAARPPKGDRCTLGQKDALYFHGQIVLDVPTTTTPI